MPNRLSLVRGLQRHGGVRLAGGGTLPWYQNGSALANSLVAYWRMDEASGQRNDSIGANHLTDNNTVGSTAGLVYPLAADFIAANNESLSIVDNAALSVGDIDFWLAAWIYIDIKNTSGNGIITKDDTVTNREYSLYYSFSSNRLTFTVWGGPSGANRDDVYTNNLGAISIATWYFVVAWHDATANTINICVNNGTPNSVAHATGCFNGSTAMNIGVLGMTSGWFHDGKLGPAMLGKNYVPTVADIAFLYNGGVGRL